MAQNRKRPNEVRAVGNRPGRAWLGVYFHCCAAYGRIYQNSEGSAYEGRCPRCGGQVRALIGDNGTTRRMFEAG